MNFYNPNEERVRIRFIHSGPQQPVTIVLGEQPIARGLNFGQSTQFILVPKGRHTVKIYSSDQNQLLVSETIYADSDKLITIDKNLKLNLTKVDPMQMMSPMQGMPGQSMQFMPQMGEMPSQSMPGQMMQNMPQMQNPNLPQGGHGMYGEMMPNMSQMQNPNLPQGGHGMYGEMMTNPYMSQMPGYPGACPCAMQYPNVPQMPGYPYQTMPETKSSLIPDKRDGMAVARLRFAHLSPNAPTVDLTLTNGERLFSDVDYREVTDYIDVTPGTYTLQIRPSLTEQVVATIPNVRLLPNTYTTIYAVGLVDGTPPLEVLILEDIIV